MAREKIRRKYMKVRKNSKAKRGKWKTARKIQVRKIRITKRKKASPKVLKLKKSKVELFEKERVLLAEERTILSFMRTGLATIGGGIVIIGFFKEFTLQLVGWALISIGFIVSLLELQSLRGKHEKFKNVKKIEKNAK